MSKRHRVRELAMQVMFLWDTHGYNDTEMARQLTHDASDDPVLRQLATNMANAAWEQRETADRWVERVAPRWPPHRQPAIDRNVLRLAVWELTNTTTPPKVVIDEAIELAKHFSTEQSAGFVNGVMDAILKEHESLTGIATMGEQGTVRAGHAPPSGGQENGTEATGHQGTEGKEGAEGEDERLQ